MSSESSFESSAAECRTDLQSEVNTSAFHEIILKKGRERSLLRRHPWIYSGAVAKVTGTPERGETVRVLDSEGSFLAYGAYSPDSAIPVKVWTFRESERIDEAFFRRKIASAFSLRKQIFAREGLPDAYRLVNAESDFLPGLVFDVFKGYGVCQITGSGMEYHRDLLKQILIDYAPEGVYERSDVESRLKDGMQMRCGVFCGPEKAPDKIRFTENTILFECSVENGHKTGFYLDQRRNRQAVMDAASGAENVLNCFSYTGGFGLAALKGGAREVLNVDSSEAALAQARINAELNGFSEEQFRTLTADVFQFLRTCRDSRQSFDMIILDPPKFADSVAQKEKAARGYKDINLLAMKLLRPGGKLFTFSCSGAMDDGLFLKVVDSAACDAKCDFRIVSRLFQGPDHPVSANFPEGLYLKGLYGIVER